MPDELYLKHEYQNDLDHAFKPAGFTLADVRRLVLAVLKSSAGGFLPLPGQADPLAPFAHLLKEKPDAT